MLPIQKHMTKLLGSVMSNMTKAYYAGQKAFFDTSDHDDNDVVAESCPYEWGTPEFKEWWEGFEGERSCYREYLADSARDNEIENLTKG